MALYYYDTVWQTSDLRSSQLPALFLAPLVYPGSHHMVPGQDGNVGRFWVEYV